ILETKALDGVPPQDHDEQERQVQEIAMAVLQDQWKSTLAPVAFARLADGAVGRVGPERLVVSAPVVVAGEAEAGRRPQDQEGRREDQPAGPPGGPLAENVVRRSPEEFRRIKGREVILAVLVEPVVIALKSRPRRVDDEPRQYHEYDSRLHPPQVAPLGF